MKNSIQLADVLGRYVSRAGYTPGQLSRLSGVPQPTITNWLEGRVKKPRHWDNLIRLAEVLHLTEAEATELLQAANHPAIKELMAVSDSEAERTLLSPWSDTIHQREQAPFQAIADLPYFVGREEVLQELKSALLNGQHVAICSLQGMGGVGKTVLAAHAAYLFRPFFPDGVLWARVDKSDPMSILSAFANAYGRDASQYTDVESRSQVVRELLATKQALIVLDNTQSSEEIRPLLPPSGTCAVIITTRHRNLAVAHGAHRIHLGEFNQNKGEALELFTQILGKRRVQREKEALIEIADLVGHLPLALAVVAGRLAYEPGWQALDFKQRLCQEKERLRILAYEEQDVRLSFNLSYELLSPEQQQVFAMLGMFSNDFSVEAVAYVTSMSPEEVHDHLRRLYSLSLVQKGRQGRYSLHPLLRDYARAKMDFGRADRLERLINYYLNYLETHKTDYNKLDFEYENIVQAIQVAADLERSSILIQSVYILEHLLETKDIDNLARSKLKQLRRTAEARNDLVGLATAMLKLAHMADNLMDFINLIAKMAPPVIHPERETASGFSETFGLDLALGVEQEVAWP
jgi:DNA-binding transcriptional ArsR family regulator/transcriptional regulator with XRE-family HTH domain